MFVFHLIRTCENQIGLVELLCALVSCSSPNSTRPASFSYLELSLSFAFVETSLESGGGSTFDLGRLASGHGALGKYYGHYGDNVTSVGLGTS